MKRITAGILAHVDSGKTTLTEALLYKSGEIRNLGRVDHKDAFLDTHQLEKSRGITIFAKQAVITLNDMEITLLDTPGHIDFSSETERVLSVLDYAVLVISAVDGIQSHTETLWKLIGRYKIPAFIFVNKTDLPGKSHDEIMTELQNRLGNECTDFSCGADALSESLALCSEELMQSFLENGSVSDTQIQHAVYDRNVVPCYFGSALKLTGTDEFISGFERFTLPPVYGESFGARIFKISEDESGTRLTHLKVTGGSLKVKDVIDGEKINQIRIYSGAKYKTINEAPAGTVCSVTGLSGSVPGTGCGFESGSESPVLEPFISYRVLLPDGDDVHTVYGYFRKLCEEDPQLHVQWNEQLREIHVRLMGEVQTEILRSIVSERYGVNVEFEMGGIVYKETIAKPVVGTGHYEPLRHYAEVHLLMEPLPAGSGLVFASDCREEVLDKNWQRLILTHLEEKTHIGVLTGSPVTDMKITVAAGKAHLKHTEGGDFRQATYRAVRQGLRSAECVLLEPWYEFSIEVPSSNAGRVLSDIQKMSGTFSPPEVCGEMSVIKGTAPVSEMMGYQSEITGFTHGKGRITCRMKGYAPCHNAEEVIRLTGYNCDLDTDNPADSVFCSHGSGYIVKWDKVSSMAHTDSGIRFGVKKEEHAPEKSLTFKRAEASEKELMEIYERTYGPVKRNEQQAMKTPKSIQPPRRNLNIRRVPTGPEYVLVDGYNIIFSWDDLKKIARDNLDLARHTLINMLCNYQGFRKCELILVFDAYKVKGSHREVEKSGGISIVYTKEAETADAYIEKTTHELGKEHRVRVATSDNLEQMIILGNGAYRIPASDFRKEVDMVMKEIHDFIEN
ncbi:MAG: NYN domain-containing protein [Porcipelethomonas sp.]